MKKIPYCDGYFADECGNIYSAHSRNNEIKKLSPYKDSKGRYLMIKIKNQNGKYQAMLVHRLVASTFIPNPDALPEVNHINHCPTDNRVENLEWCSHHENIRHSYETLGPIRNYNRCVLYVGDKAVQECKSIEEACRVAQSISKINVSSLNKYLRCGNVSIIPIDESVAAKRTTAGPSPKVINKSEIQLIRCGETVYRCETFVELQQYLFLKYNYKVSRSMLSYACKNHVKCFEFFITR